MIFFILVFVVFGSIKGASYLFGFENAFTAFLALLVVYTLAAIQWIARRAGIDAND